jgi:hypothetical protein
MSFNLSDFDATTHEPLNHFDPVPAGTYRAMAIASENKPTRAGTGHYLEIMWEIIEGEYQGRRLWSRLNLDHPNEETVKFALRELSSICRALGVLRPRDSTELHNKPLLLRVAVKPRKDNGELANFIKGYESVQGNGAGAPAAAAASSTTAGTKPAWRR